MSTLKVKVCCIQSVEEARLAHGAGADAVGLVGPMPSGPGVIPGEAIAQIAAEAPRALKRVLLSSNSVPAAIARRATGFGVDAVQLVNPGAFLDGARLKTLRPDLEVWAVVHVTGEASLQDARAAAAWADALLLDTGSPSQGVLGGTGRTHDWDLSARIAAEAPVPVWLAGGLKPHNVAEAVARVRPFGVDVCTGVRTDGRLHAGKLKAFIAAARSARP